MGSSAKKKKEKKKDFQKVKLKVGKTKAKPDNHTSTSFKAKAVVLPNQTIAPTCPAETFNRHVVLLDSKADSQRKESLIFITNAITGCALGLFGLPQPVASFFPRIQGLVLDRSAGVRNQLVKLLQALPKNDVRDYCAAYKCSPLLLTLTGMSHLSLDVRSTSLDVFEWLVGTAGDIVVTSPGGWIKTISHFLTLLKWSASKVDHKNGTGPSKNAATAGLFGHSDSESKLAAKTLRMLALLLRTGLANTGGAEHMAGQIGMAQSWFPYVAGQPFLFPAIPNQLGHLNLFGNPIDDDSAQLLDRAERQAAFAIRVETAIRAGLALTKPVGGDIGRAAAAVEKTIEDGMAGFDRSGLIIR